MSLRIRFCGTRGYIEERSELHAMHSAHLLICEGKRLLLDAGEDWTGELDPLRPDWIAITHAHPDHSFALAKAPDVPVYVTQESYERLSHYPVRRFRIIEPWREVRLGPFRIIAYPVVHSIRAPAVGFRVRAGGVSVAYAPDVVSIPDEARALKGLDAYIGDGATLTRPLVRRRGDVLFGHTTVRAQIGWCKRNAVPRMYVVHCGKQLVEMDPQTLQRQIDTMAAGELAAVVTFDGMEITL